MIIKSKVAFWPGWSNVHSDWSPVLIPAWVWKLSLDQRASVKIVEYGYPLYASIFFLLFGTTEEALDAFSGRS